MPGLGFRTKPGAAPQAAPAFLQQHKELGGKRNNDEGGSWHAAENHRASGLLTGCPGTAGKKQEQDAYAYNKGKRGRHNGPPPDGLQRRRLRFQALLTEMAGLLHRQYRICQ